MNVEIFKIKNQQKSAGTSRFTLYQSLLAVFVFLLPISIFAQTEPEVSASIDTSRIRIGEQIKYRIDVEAATDDVVIFPEDQSFSPMEMVEAYKIDTSRAENRLRLLREYALTQFDSGSYVIPRQRIIINDRDFYTDSMRVEVANVVVDTTKQKLYPIKPSVEAPFTFSIPEWIWWPLGALALTAGILFFIFRRQKRKEEAAQKLPPYEQAMVELEQLDRSQLLESRDLKEYYSQLTNVVRRYLDEKVYDRALESTTNELITFLEMKKDANELLIDDIILADLKQMLQRADLAKFANSRPDVITAKSDRASAEKIINKAKTAVPEPTEEELLKNQAYLEEQARKRKRRRIVLGIVVGVVVLIAAATAFVATKGVDFVKDNYLGHPNKELLEGEWVRSEYGNPAIVITTPEVLVREEGREPIEEMQGKITNSEFFAHGSVMGNFFVAAEVHTLKNQARLNLEATTEGIYDLLESQGAKNILMMDEEVTTVGGTEGVRIFGSYDIENPVTKENQRMSYSILNFLVNGGLQQLTIIYPEGDTYAEEISKRIIESVEFNNGRN